MRPWIITLRAAGLLAAACALSSAPRAADAQAWTDWTSRTLSNGTTNGTATGTLLVGGSSVGVTFTGDVFGQTQLVCGTDYWASNPAVYTSPANGLTVRPTGCDLVSLVGGTGRPVTQTLTFSEAVVNPVLAILSLGQPGVIVTYDFDRPFDLLNSGAGFFGGSAAGSLFADPGNVLRGIEGNGLLRFNGTISSISWTVPTAENWHGFTVGAQGVGQPTTTAPEPTSVVLVATGALALAWRARRRRRAL